VFELILNNVFTPICVWSSYWFGLIQKAKYLAKNYGYKKGFENDESSLQIIYKQHLLNHCKLSWRKKKNHFPSKDASFQMYNH
jgi:hypothetical protein